MININLSYLDFLLFDINDVLQSLALFLGQLPWWLSSILCFCYFGFSLLAGQNELIARIMVIFRRHLSLQLHFDFLQQIILQIQRNSFVAPAGLWMMQQSNNIYRFGNNYTKPISRLKTVQYAIHFRWTFSRLLPQYGLPFPTKAFLETEQVLAIRSVVASRLCT